LLELEDTILPMLDPTGKLYNTEVQDETNERIEFLHSEFLPFALACVVRICIGSINELEAHQIRPE
jgi:hypothetical protein